MRGVFRPSRVLGLLICVVIGSFLGFVFWQRSLVESDANDARLLAAAQWVLVMGAFTAMVGWMVSAIVTVRNSVKQHTINTLLQSRLSQAYVERLRIINDAYSPIGQGIRVIKDTDFDDLKQADQLNAMRYFLNYYEFIALAIRYGDLDEALMKASMRGIVCTQFKVGEILINKAVVTNTANFEHLRWLVKRWQDRKAGIVDFLFLVGSVIVAVVAGYFVSNTALQKLTTNSPMPPSKTGQAGNSTPAASAAAGIGPSQSPSPSSPAASASGSASKKTKP